MGGRRITWEEYTKTDRYLRTVKTVKCFNCGHEYHVDINIDGSDEDWVCRKSCLDVLEAKEV
jgi:hypothetical protein